MGRGAGTREAENGGRLSWVLPALAVFAAALLLRMPFLDWPMISDEGGYAYTAHWWGQGLTLYGSDLWFDRPQGIFLAYELGMSLLGEATWAIRLWGGLWAAATAVVVVGLTRDCLDRFEGAWGMPFLAGLLTATLSVQPGIEGFTSNAEVFALLPATASAWMLLRRHWGLAGLMASAGFMLKPSAGSVAVLALVWLIRERASWKEWAAFGLAALSLPLAGFIHGWATVGAGPYLHAVVGFRMGLPDTTGFGLWESVSDTLHVWLPPLVFGFLGLPAMSPRIRLFLGAWLLSAFLGMALGGNWFWHYFIQLVPPVAVAAVFGCRWLWSRGGFVTRWAAAFPLALTLALALPWAFRAPERGAMELYGRPGYALADEVAAYLSSRTREEDRIYVAFEEAEIYHLARRRSAFPYLFRLEVLHMPGAFPALLGMVSERRARHIFLLDPIPGELDPENRFRALLERGYVVDTVFGGRPLYRRR